MFRRTKMWLRLPVMLLTGLMLFVAGCSTSTPAPAPGTTVTPAPAAPAKTYTIRVAHDQATTNPRQAIAETFKKVVEEKSKGQVKVEIFPAAQLFPAKDQVSALVRGDIQMTMPAWDIVATVDPVAAIFSVPGMFPSLEVALSVAEGPMGDLMAKRLEPKKIELAGVFPVSVTVLTSNDKHMKSLDDVKGQKLRTAPSAYQTSVITGLGGTPVNVAAAELFTALQQGQVDGAWVNRAMINSSKLWETQKYALDNFLFYPTAPVVISSDFLKTLPADLQKVVRDAVKESVKTHAEQIMKDDVKLLELIKTKMTVETLKIDDAVLLRIKPAMDELEKKIGADLLNQVKAAVKAASK